MADSGPAGRPWPEVPSLRRMTSEDISAVHELERRLFPHDAWPKHLFQEELAQAEPAVPADRATRRYWVAVVGGQRPETEGPGERGPRDAARWDAARTEAAAAPQPEADAREPVAAAAEAAQETQHGAGVGRIVGYAGMMCVLPFADVQTLAVAPEVQRTGLGSRLLRSLVEEARGRGAEQVLLEVRADNPGAQALYQREGFSHIHTRAQYYPDGEDALIMQKLLKDQTR